MKKQSWNERKYNKDKEIRNVNKLLLIEKRSNNTVVAVGIVRRANTNNITPLYNI